MTVEELIGRWATDPGDHESLGEYGRVELEFRADGKLVYTIHAEGKDQKMFLTYRLEDGVLITDQPSQPREERTPFLLAPNGKLELAFGGQKSSYFKLER